MIAPPLNALACIEAFSGLDRLACSRNIRGFADASPRPASSLLNPGRISQVGEGRAARRAALTLALLLPFASLTCRRAADGRAGAAAPAQSVAANRPAPVEAERANAEDGPLPSDDLGEQYGDDNVPPEPAAEPAEQEDGAADGSEPPYRAALDERQTQAERIATRLASLSPAQCRAELQRRKLAIARAGGSTPGVATPVRLSGVLEGVRFLTPGRKSVYGVLDCRLSLVLAELAKLLAESGVAALHIDNMYRPRAHLPGSRKKSQHAYGMAVDIYGFTLADGTTLVVERDFHGTLGAPPCGPDARLAPDSDTRALSLRNLFCTIARSRLFNYLLTPNYNEAHRDHIHLDIQRKTRAHVVR